MAWTLSCWWKRLKVSHCDAAPEKEKKTIKTTERTRRCGRMLSSCDTFNLFDFFFVRLFVRFMSAG